MIFLPLKKLREINFSLKNVQKELTKFVKIIDFTKKT